MVNVTTMAQKERKLDKGKNKARLMRQDDQVDKKKKNEVRNKHFY